MSGGQIASPSEAPLRRRARPSVQTTVNVVGMVALCVLALLTPGFLTLPNLIALTGTLSLIGCVAVGMTFITLSGNIMSFALGATSAVTSMLVAYLTQWGAVPAIVLGLLFAVFVTGIQGLVVGLFRANALIVSIASLSLLVGLTQYITGGQTVYVSNDALALFKTRPLGVPAALLVFVLVVLVGELLLRRTRFGRNVVLVGSNHAAAVVAGIRTWRSMLGCYVAAGVFTGITGVLIAARFGSSNMEFGVGYDYSAISAVLVGGTAIGGGFGSVLRTMFGVLIIAILQSLLLLYGLDVQYQYLLIGLIVLGAILLQARGRAR